MLEVVYIYTDGACSPNPGKGGWGAILISKVHGKRKEISGSEERSTNNRMEMTAVIQALRSLKKPCKVFLYTDSLYIYNAFNKKWLKNWKEKNWKARNGKDILNKDLWMNLFFLNKYHNIKWNWVKGHDGNEENEKADALAVGARKKLK